MIARWFEPRRPNELSPALKWVAYAALLVWSAIVYFPLYWVAITAFKQPVHVAGGPLYLPFIDFEPTLDAWRYVLITTGRDTLRPYVNSVIVAGASTALAAMIGSMAAYALTRIQYRPRVSSVGLFVVSLGLSVVLVWAVGLSPAWSLATGAMVFLLALRPVSRRFDAKLGNDDILFWMVSQRILPPVVTAIPVYVMFQKVGLLDTRAALVISYMTVNLPIVIWLMYDFFDGIPRELEECAGIDGASRFRIFFDLMLPLARPGLVATAMLVLILSWNEYLFALFLSTARAQTMPLLVAAQNATRGPQWWTMCVLILLMILPVVGVAAFLQRFIARGLLVGALKG